ncbi:hypothetical protein A3B05_03335 [Candidatus Giovannonibacteria bacterium RIFCSPLOWO2_01_FULL_43_160]|uniref:Uncharacterized protein n=2 Tax=Candidatus Giovannoniibacteriota TaxID=1752738 RepID=A0A0G1L465_9BACT|nr:MAG: hypothetical protein UV72_C0005G0005 [Candidatus Giovannonibacteria bacterium GW2011_GWB1_43_13]KKS99451.1 MAG: hypothetical protein UV75_C0004G0005 [Candidatus Giovannonibacteria bacterium GW2011_GWA1_43_15]KKT63372.1 MAG: hypothetical protein UW55_C0004G0005 [Candidatus Giovannonibacteria bacterium GW2011_GWA2_44_26]OGF70691.1 MAG: hypothetical protein A3C76_01770 [Candidatus Giovannonibacteria bacterium RIFCSPHIGHO2_02_FULL_44_51]OGF72450.1 MAG: hypothetical protein A3E35_02665 [Cand
MAKQALLSSAACASTMDVPVKKKLDGDLVLASFTCDNQTAEHREHYWKGLIKKPDGKEFRCTVIWLENQNSIHASRN